MPKSNLPAALLAFVLSLVFCLLVMKFLHGNYELSDGVLGMSPANLRFAGMVGAGLGAVSALLTIGIAVSRKVGVSMATLLPILGAAGFAAFLIVMKR